MNTAYAGGGAGTDHPTPSQVGLECWVCLVLLFQIKINYYSIWRTYASQTIIETLNYNKLIAAYISISV